LYDIGDQYVPPIPEGWISTGSSQKTSKMQLAIFGDPVGKILLVRVAV
jgi:hypothetical protein